MTDSRNTAARRTFPMNLWLSLAALCVGTALPAAQAQEEASPKLVDIAREVSPAIVITEWTLQYDAGDAPESGGWRSRCPSCGNYHVDAASSVLEEERPVEWPGFLVAADRLITSDPLVHPRFVKEIVVRVGDETRSASVSRVFSEQGAIELTLDEPVEAGPLDFSTGGGDRPSFAVIPHQSDGRWIVTVKPIGSSVSLDGSDPKVTEVDQAAILVSAAGAPVTLNFSSAMPADGQPPAPPGEWTGLDRDGYDRKLADLEMLTKQAMPRIHLSFRSPAGETAEENMMMSGRFFPGRDDEEANKTERDVTGLVISERRILVPVGLDAETTARLRRMTVHLDDGRELEASFAASLKDYKAFVIETDEPLPASLELSQISPEDLIDVALLAARHEQHGESSETHVGRQRISSHELGWRRQLEPQVPAYDRGEPLYLFDQEMNLVALPMSRRKIEEEVYYAREGAPLMLARYLRPVIADLEAYTDVNNVPRGEEDENRLAWLGAELQELTPELAQLNNVSAQTSGGQNGALVSFVYPDSPAEKLGLEAGVILLRLHVPGRAAPLTIEAVSDRMSSYPFPWEQLDEVPEAYFDQLPRPWPSARSGLAETLTTVGIGETVELEYVQDGELQRTEIEIEQSPPHYDNAARLEHTASGLTLREMTYEVRRYFQLEPDAPGLMIHEIEPGSIASKSGLKPREYITHVNDTAIRSREDFADAVRGEDAVRLQVIRFNEGRVVRLPLPQGDEEGGEAEADVAPDAAPEIP